jgi:hypothetical protein
MSLNAMTIFRDHECIPAHAYAKQLGISVEEMVGLIKVRQYYGELRNGEWYVEPNTQAPKTTIARLAATIGFMSLLGLIHTGIYLWRNNFQPDAWLYMAKWMSVYVAIGLFWYLLPKIHQLTARGE